MHVHNFLFPEELFKELRSVSEETGAPVSELVRRAVREYLEKKKKKDAQKAQK
jgi:metal-responsive CopG/Arc/MetJ family transcriptional regulator